MAEKDVPAGGEEFGRMFGPDMVDNSVRQALAQCWLLLPKHRKTEEQVEAEFRRIVERALRDFREDAERFGLARGP